MSRMRLGASSAARLLVGQSAWELSHGCSAGPSARALSLFTPVIGSRTRCERRSRPPAARALDSAESSITRVGNESWFIELPLNIRAGRRRYLRRDPSDRTPNPTSHICAIQDSWRRASGQRTVILSRRPMRL